MYEVNPNACLLSTLANDLRCILDIEATELYLRHDYLMIDRKIFGSVSSNILIFRGSSKS